MQLSIFFFGKRHNEDIKPYHFTETVKICLVRFQKKKQNLLIFFKFQRLSPHLKKNKYVPNRTVDQYWIYLLFYYRKLNIKRHVITF